MIAWLLFEIGRSPHVAFTERDLREHDHEGFVELARLGVLRRLRPLEPGDTYAWHTGHRLLTVAEAPDGTLEVLDEYDPEFAPVALRDDESILWSADIAVVARRYQDANGLAGTPGELHDRLWFLGERRRGSATTAFFLGLVGSDEEAELHLPALRSFVRQDYDRLAALCPAYQPSPRFRQRLEAVGMRVIGTDSTNPLLLQDEPARAVRLENSLLDKTQWQPAGLLDGRRKRGRLGHLTREELEKLYVEDIERDIDGNFVWPTQEAFADKLGVSAVTLRRDLRARRITWPPVPPGFLPKESAN